MRILEAVGRPSPDHKGTVISLVVQVKGKGTTEEYIKLPPDQHLVIQLDGNEVENSCIYPDDYYQPIRQQDVTFIGDLDESLCSDYNCRRYLLKVFRQVIAKFELTGEESKDGAEFQAPGFSSAGMKHDVNWPANQLWKCTELCRRQHDLKSLAQVIEEVADEINARGTQHSRTAIMVLVRWQSEPLDLQAGGWDSLYNALKKARALRESDRGRIPIPVFLFIVGRPGQRISEAAKGKLKSDLGIDDVYEVDVPPECPDLTKGPEPELPETVSPTLEDFHADVNNLCSPQYVVPITTTWLFDEKQHCVGVGLTWLGQSEAKFQETFAREPIRFEGSDRRWQGLWATFVMVLVGWLCVSYALYLVCFYVGQLYWRIKGQH